MTCGVFSFFENQQIASKAEGFQRYVTHSMVESNLAKKMRDLRSFHAIFNVPTD
jgi:hypothetical protein